MPCRINLRHDQTISLRPQFSTSRVTIFAPQWVQQGLHVLGEKLKGTKFGVFDTKDRPLSEARNSPVETLEITENFSDCSLKLLERVSRNEFFNTSGRIDWSLYQGIAKEKAREVILSLRDLVRQCCIVGMDETSSFGGYGCSKECQDKQRVYVCDLAALQFQQPENSGRLVLIKKNNPHRGILDDLIFKNVVGEDKRTFPEVDEAWHQQDSATHQRYRLQKLHESNYCYLDTFAYSKFVEKDVLLSGTAFSRMVQRHHPGDKINFKFLKYGTGFFAGEFQRHLEQLILPAVLTGLEELMHTRVEAKEVIAQVELPFYTVPAPGSLESKKIAKFRERFGIPIVFSRRDALKGGSDADGSRLITATTNCGDNHAPFGNEMRFGSVDAAIAENLQSKGHIFCPNINLQMNEEFIEF